jgi:ElaB/YqjD/DUF883 family membrane-anchored ribosome-binding protein
MKKTDLHRACLELLKGQISERSKAVMDAQESVFSNAKSSAGDKHETGRAMAQIELEKLSNNLSQSKQLYAALQQVKQGVCQQVETGALCETNVGLFYVSVSLGKIDVEGKPVFCLSSAAPISQAMMGLKQGDRFTINGVTHTIKIVQ